MKKVQWEKFYNPKAEQRGRGGGRQIGSIKQEQWNMGMSGSTVQSRGEPTKADIMWLVFIYF